MKGIFFFLYSQSQYITYLDYGGNRKFTVSKTTSTKFSHSTTEFQAVASSPLKPRSGRAAAASVSQTQSWRPKPPLTQRPAAARPALHGSKAAVRCVSNRGNPSNESIHRASQTINQPTSQPTGQLPIRPLSSSSNWTLDRPLSCPVICRSINNQLS